MTAYDMMNTYEELMNAIKWLGEQSRQLIPSVES